LNKEHITLSTVAYPRGEGFLYIGGYDIVIDTYVYINISTLAHLLDLLIDDVIDRQPFSMV
jgi:hypothetical protein